MVLVLEVVMASLVVGVIIYAISLYNQLVHLLNNIDKAWSNIDVILKQRHDEVPKLVEVCNSYMQHERETLEAVTRARVSYARSSTVEDKAKAENRLVGALGTLFAVAEQYPDLKADREFLTVQQRISAIESSIADRREFYNDSVNVYNIRIGQIPGVLFARLLGYHGRPLLEIAQTERQDVRLAFANRQRAA
jgi:LemA protein